MADGVKHGSTPQDVGRLPGVSRNLKRVPWPFLVLLLVIWVGLPLVPEDTGFRFGMGYRAFFTVMMLLSGLLFWFLGIESIPQPKTTVGVVASLAGVFVVTVALLATAGLVYPQFDLPEEPEQAATDPVERGDDLFWSSNVGCFRCHTISGTGGTRGPDLTQVASRAGERVPDIPAEQYLFGKVKAGKSYRYNVPEYTPMMPEFETTLTEEQIQDIVAFLLSLE